MKQQYLFALEHHRLTTPLQPTTLTPANTLSPGHSPHNPLYFQALVEKHWTTNFVNSVKIGVSLIIILVAYSIYRTNKILPGISEKKINVAETSNVRFDDVRGIDECKAELQEIVAFLKDPRKFQQSGAKLPKGVLLTGEPGTGKTLLAKAIAGEAGVKFFFASGSDFDEVFVGLGAKRIRELFEEAKRNAPCIVFIDEIDALGGSRASKDINFNRQSLNQLLVEIDGFKTTDNIIVIGATNLPGNLDSALKRSGRFDKEVNIPLPDIRGRIEIFNLYLSRVKHSPDVDVRHMANMTFGKTGADISNIVNLAVLNSVKAGREAFDMRDFDLAIERTLVGVDRKSLVVTEEEKMNTALHEMGHVIATLFTKGANKLYRVNILPRGNALGVTISIPDHDMYSQTIQEVLASIDVSMGGRCAEELFSGRENLTTGCGSDMSNAVQRAYLAVGSGMFPELTGMLYEDDLRDAGVEKRNLIDKSVEQLLKESRMRVMELLSANKGLVLYLAKHLKEQENLSAADVIGLMEQYNNGR
mmetsp:Transcript_16545/g.29805  ORF Transcript_16545/g.29805 Transcript_16545/m.29805 type:complete len:531 (+) Transcript_16545:141-1733(+)